MSDRRDPMLLADAAASRLLATLEYAPIGLVYIWPDGTMTLANQRFCDIVGRSAQAVHALRLQDIASPQDREVADDLLHGERQTTDTDAPYVCEMRLTHGRGTTVWVRLTATRAPGYSHPAPYLVVVDDITDRRSGEQRLAAQTALSGVLATAPHFNDAAPEMLRIVGEMLEWDIGLLWCINGDTGDLRVTSTWQAPGSAADELLALSQAIGFGAGEDLPGSVWEQGVALWVEDVTTVADRARAAALCAAGMRSAFAFPIQPTSGLCGVMEFYRRQPRLYDAALVALGTAFGLQAGEYIERRRAEITLRVRDDAVRYQAHLLDRVEQAVIGTDRAGIITYWNQFAETLYGWSASEVLGRSIIEITPSDMSLAQASDVMEMLQTGQSWSGEFGVRRRDGSTFPAQVTNSPVFDEAGQLVGMVGVSSDITAWKRIEERAQFLMSAGARLASSLDYEQVCGVLARLVVPHLADWCALQMLDENGQLKLLTVAHRDPEQEALMWELDRLYPPLGDAAVRPLNVVHTGEAELYPEVSRDALLATAQDDQHAALLAAYRCTSCMMIPLVARGRAQGVLVCGMSEGYRLLGAADLELAEDLAHRAALALDNALLYRETQNAVRLRDDFLSLAAHELRTPLTSLGGYAQMVHRRMERTRTVGDRDLHALNTIVEQAERITRLLGLLLDVSQMEAGQVKLERAPIDLSDLAEHISEAMQTTQAASQDHTIVFYRSDEPTIVSGDALRLGQVLQNLIQNAIKYSPQGGQITVQVDHRVDHAAIVISDQGIGIPADAIPHLFTRFYRASNSGTPHIAGVGIGLYVVKELVERHGGSIDVVSVEGQGSTFTVRLPLEQ